MASDSPRLWRLQDHQQALRRKAIGKRNRLDVAGDVAFTWHVSYDRLQAVHWRVRYYASMACWLAGCAGSDPEASGAT